MYKQRYLVNIRCNFDEDITKSLVTILFHCFCFISGNLGNSQKGWQCTNSRGYSWKSFGVISATGKINEFA